MSVKLRDDGDSKFFHVGEPLCLYTTFPVRECMHCQLRPAPPVPKWAVTCTAIDHETGVIIFDTVMR